MSLLMNRSLSHLLIHESKEKGSEGDFFRSSAEFDISSVPSFSTSSPSSSFSFSLLPRVLLQLIFTHLDAQAHLVVLTQVCSSWHNAERGKDSWIDVKIKLREEHTKLLTRTSYSEWKDAEDEIQREEQLSARKMSPAPSKSLFSSFFSSISSSIAAHTSRKKPCIRHILSSLAPCSALTISIVSLPFSISNLVTFLVRLPYLSTLQLYTNHVVYCLALWEHLPLLEYSLPQTDITLHISFLPMDLSMDGASFLPSLPSSFSFQSMKIALTFADTDLPHYPPTLIINLYNHFSNSLTSIDLTNANRHQQEEVERLIMRQEESRHFAIGANTIDLLYTRTTVAGPTTLPLLSTLILDGLLQRPTNSLQSLSQYMPSLSRLSLLHCRSVDNNSLLSLASLSSLSYLALSFHPSLDMSTLLEFLSLSPVTHLLLNRLGGVRPELDCRTLVDGQCSNNLSTLVMTGIHIIPPLSFGNNTLRKNKKNGGISFFHSLRTLSIDFPHHNQLYPSPDLLSFLFHTNSFPLLYDCQLICPSYTWNCETQNRKAIISGGHSNSSNIVIQDQRSALLFLLAESAVKKNPLRILRSSVDEAMRKEMMNLAPQINFTKASLPKLF